MNGELSMLSAEEKKHIKDVLSEGLGINRNINLAYFLTMIVEMDKGINELVSRIQKVEYNQRIIDEKLDRIIRLIKG